MWVGEGKGEVRTGQEDRSATMVKKNFILREKVSLLLSHQGRNCVDISSWEVEMCSFFTFQVADPLTFAKNRSALCFLTFALLFFHVHAQ